MTQIQNTYTLTTTQALNALSGNGTAVDVTGADAAFFSIGPSAGTAGVFTFERSSDSGSNWAPLTCTRASDGAAVSVTAAAENGNAYVVPLFDGPMQVRARISTNWVTASPLVRVVEVA